MSETRIRELFRPVRNAFETHRPALCEAILNSTGPIIELGMGDGSTPLLSEVARITGREVFSFDHNLEWSSQFMHLQSERHHIQWLPSWDACPIESSHWGVAFVDHAPAERRIVDLERLRERADLIVVHDTEPEADRHYHYQPSFARFRHRFDRLENYVWWPAQTVPFRDREEPQVRALGSIRRETVAPNTSVLSNAVDLSDFRIPSVEGNVVIVVPSRTSVCPWRGRALELMLRELSGLAIPNSEIRVADAGGETFSIARSINEAVSRSSAETILIYDGDSLVGREQIMTAIELARRSPGLAIAWSRGLYLTKEETESFYAGHNIEAPHERLIEGVGGVRALSRESFEKVGGVDERFIGWGGEDTAFEAAVDTLAGPTRRVRGLLVHLWHTPQGRSCNHVHRDVTYDRSYAVLRDRYLSARGEREHMASILAERS